MRWTIEPPDAKRDGRLARTGEPGTGRMSCVLDLVVQRQELVRWCWAAIASSLGDYYRTRSIKQREIAGELLNCDCSQVEADPEAADRCNVYAMLDDALRLVGCFSHWSPGRPTFERICSEIDAGRPVCLCVDWKTGGSHYAAITGYYTETQELYVADPLHGCSVQEYKTFPSRYQGIGGYWRGTFWTNALAPTPNSHSQEGS